MLCKFYWIVLYTVHFTAFSLEGAVFSGHGVEHKQLRGIILACTQSSD